MQLGIIVTSHYLDSFFYLVSVMPVIILKTVINATAAIVFDLARSIDLYQVSTQQTKEKVVGGRLSGLIELNETVTWQARHFGIVQRLTSKITAFDKPGYFVDEMVQGAFKSFKHEHVFEDTDSGMIMTDVFTYQSPFGVLGRLADKLFLKNYMEVLLIQRNQVIKDYAENNIIKS